MIYYNSWNSCGWLNDVKFSESDQLDLFVGDIRDSERISQAVQGCHYVFHLSSLIGIPYSYNSPRSYVETNVTGALNVLEACRQNKNLERIIHTSTSEVYGTAQTVPISEDHSLVGQSLYSASKIAADKLAESYYLSFELRVVIARPFNTFGPRQTAREVIPTIASQLISGSHQSHFGSLTPTRDFVFVEDTVNGIISLALSDRAIGEVVNIGTGHEWSIKRTYEKLCKILGCQSEIIEDQERVRPGKSEVHRLVADTSKISNLTNWKPMYSFDEGLDKTVGWITENIYPVDNQKYGV